MTWRCLLILVLSVGLTGGAPVDADDNLPDNLPESLRERLRHRLEVLDEPGELVAGGEVLYAVPALRSFYEERGWQPAWLHEDHSRALSLSDLPSAVEAARDHGLEPEHYHLDGLRSGLAYLATTTTGERDSRRLADLELLASDAFLTLASHYTDGRVDPASIDPGWFLERGDQALMESLASASGGRRDGPRRALAALLPDEPAYRLLVERLALYRELSDNGDWSSITSRTSLRPGDSDSRVPVIRRRLVYLGDHLPPEPGLAGADSEDYDETLAAAVRRFQARHGLEQDAVVGPRTLAALDVAPAARVDQLRANLERWRWLPRSLGDELILVNIAGFQMDVISGGESVMRRRVIVGRPFRRTPVFTERMTYLVLNPSWEVPHRLAVQDKLPEIVKDPEFLSRLGFRVLRGWGAEERNVDPETVDWEQLSASHFPYRLRQTPGPQNALGRVKFMFPNPHNVYLHDTPTRGLFAREERAFSSGCIRVESPIELAEWLLGARNGPTVMTSEEIQRILASGRETTVRLGRDVPVVLLYWTAWVEDDGTVQYRNDIYGRDEPLIAALDRPPPREP